MYWKTPLALVLCIASSIWDGVVRAQPPTVAQFLDEYHALAEKTAPLLNDIRGGRQRGELIKRDDVLIMRKAVSDLMKKIRKYDQDHVLGARRKGRPYEERADVLTLLRACDGMNRVLDAEVKVNDWLQLVRRYEESWKQAEAALPEGP